MISLDHQNFPFIYLSVAVARFGEGVSTLTRSNFQVTENGNLQTDYFNVIPPETGGGVRAVDIVFLMDNSGSMDVEQNTVRDNVEAFVDELVARGVDCQLGLCRFGAWENSGNPIIEDNGTLTSNADYFKNTVWNRNVTSGGFEPGWDALYEAVTSFAFRGGAQKVFILITDETPTDNGNIGTHTQEEAIAILKDHFVTAFALIELSDAHAISDYGEIAQQTNGEYYDILEPLDGILDYISNLIANNYRITYKSSRPVFDGVERHVVVTVSYSGDQATCEGTYIPGSAPMIQRTQDTLDLHNQPWAAGTQFNIRAEITDAVVPYVQSATVYYRRTGDANYTPTAMTHSSDIWAGTIPGGAVSSPGVDYYISATDGQSTVTEPSVDPRTSPHQLAILPNEAPRITHTPPADVPINTPVAITAEIIDTTNALASERLHYRKTGQLIYQCNGEMTNTAGTSYRDTIPSGYVTAAGVEYYIYAEDDLGVGNYHGTPDVPHVVSVSTNPPPDTKIETADIDSVNGTARFTWSGSDDTTPATELTYSYRLVRPGPAYDAWSTWSAGKTKEYTDLAPGSYKFQVRAKDADEAIDPSPASKEFAILEPQAAEWVRIRNTPNGIWRLRKDEWTDSGPSDDVLMLLPNQWVLKVVSKTDSEGQTMEYNSYIWWRVENPGNGIVGLMAAKKKNGSIEEYLVPSDPAPAEIIQEGERSSETLLALCHYYNATDIHQTVYASTDLYDANDWGYNSRYKARDANHIAEWINDKYEIPLEFLLAIAVAEIGSYDFNNEEYGAKGGGIGIMQITGQHNCGWGSNLKCYDCSPSSGISTFYTNSRQGIYANVKDGLRVFQYDVGWAFREWDPPSAEKIPCLAGAPDDSLRSIAAVWYYNGGGVANYLKRVSDALGSLDTYYGDYRASLEDCGHGSVLDDATLETWQTYFECMDKNKIKAHLGSPGELRVYDTAGRIAGSVDGNPVEEVPGSAYSTAHHTVVIFCPLAGYTYEVHGTDTGLYQLDVARVAAGERITFIATDIPISPSAVHQYIIDWDALTRGEDGVTLQVDNDGDGAFEKTIQAGSTLDGTTTPIANQPPAIDILAPVSGESISDPHYQLQWQATDPDTPASSLSIELFYSTNGGTTWTSISPNEANDGAYDWDIGALHGGEYWLKLVAEDAEGGTSEATVGPFTISVFEGNVIVAPNPVTNTGTAFFYTLPEGTSTAKLMIFSPSGRLFFETPLDTDSTRFPNAGTWNPVDQDGIPLANGPYVYVLIADGKVIGQGKMVIQR